MSSLKICRFWVCVFPIIPWRKYDWQRPLWRGLSETNSGGRCAPRRFCSLPRNCLCAKCLCAFLAPRFAQTKKYIRTALTLRKTQPAKNAGVSATPGLRKRLWKIVFFEGRRCGFRACVFLWLSDLFWARVTVWCIPRIGAENKSVLFPDFLLISAVLRARGRFQNPRQTLVRTNLRLKRFPNPDPPTLAFFGGGGGQKKQGKPAKKARDILFAEP